MTNHNVSFTTDSKIYWISIMSILLLHDLNSHTSLHDPVFPPPPASTNLKPIGSFCRKCSRNILPLLKLVVTGMYQLFIYYKAAHMYEQGKAIDFAVCRYVCSKNNTTFILVRSYLHNNYIQTVSMDLEYLTATVMRQ